MSMSDPISDMLTRIRNGLQARKANVSTPSSKVRERILDVLEREGFIRGYEKREISNNRAELDIQLKYHEGQPVIQTIRRVSTPGRRVYSSVKDLPRVHNGLGISVVSTPKGVLSDAEARESNVGGEILCTVL
ncbi:30S ribosomal protein S8 [Yunchengibacter salinarum]|uniref:30S ribosomal protein S8 n=1 Tax=Yunchengibacter salinarum TaxID=3133399 RepID=UPI0035B5BC57